MASCSRVNMAICCCNPPGEWEQYGAGWGANVKPVEGVEFKPMHLILGGQLGDTDNEPNVFSEVTQRGGPPPPPPNTHSACQWTNLPLTGSKDDGTKRAIMSR